MLEDGFGDSRWLKLPLFRTRFAAANGECKQRRWLSSVWKEQQSQAKVGWVFREGHA